MNRLLTGNLIRLRKNIVFWLSLVCAMIGPLYTVLNNWYYKNLWDMGIQADAAFLLSGADYFFMVALAVVISLFVGTEFSDNTIRNKLIAGHTKVSLFLSNLITCIVVGVIMYLVSVAASCIGIPLLDKLELPIDKLFLQMACAVVSISVIAAFICTITMVIGNRVISAIVSMLSVIGIQLIPPVLWANVDYYTENGLLDTFQAKIDVFMYDWLPTCQIYRLTSEITDIPKNIYLFPMYSAILILVIGTIGAIIFRKKNLK